jgi:hypothetical protein
VRKGERDVLNNSQDGVNRGRQVRSDGRSRLGRGVEHYDGGEGGVWCDLCLQMQHFGTLG